MSTLTTFEFIGYLLDDQIPVYEEILRGAPQLRNVAFDTSINVQDSISIFPLNSQLALVNSISALTSLRITRAIFIGGSLVEALRHCQSTLNSLVLRHVGLSTSDEYWVPILQTLLAAPNLTFVELQLIQAASADTLWRDGEFKVPCKHGCQEPHIFKGRGQVTDGLHSLLEHHSCLHI
jgi:hypothetical protein